MRLWTVISLSCAAWMFVHPSIPSHAETVKVPAQAAAAPTPDHVLVPDPRRPGARSTRRGPLRASGPRRTRTTAPRSIRRGKWKLELARAERVAFLRSVARLRPLPAHLIGQLEARTVVRSLGETACAARSSCAIGTFTQLGDVRTAAYELEFFHGSLDGSVGSRFLIAHELGHLIEYEGLSGSGQRAFLRAFQTSPAWRACFPYRGGCVPAPEVFADQFAMYSLGQPGSLTAYDVPRLVSDATFERLLRTHYSALT